MQTRLKHSYLNEIRRKRKKKTEARENKLKAVNERKKASLRKETRKTNN